MAYLWHFNDVKNCHQIPDLQSKPLPCFFIGPPIANMVNTFKGRNNFFIVRDHNDGGVVSLRHLVQDQVRGLKNKPNAVAWSPTGQSNRPPLRVPRSY
jgi:hypothetical protein